MAAAVSTSDMGVPLQGGAEAEALAQLGPLSDAVTHLIQCVGLLQAQVEELPDPAQTRSIAGLAAREEVALLLLQQACAATDASTATPEESEDDLAARAASRLRSLWRKSSPAPAPPSVRALSEVAPPPEQDARSRGAKPSAFHEPVLEPPPLPFLPPFPSPGCGPAGAELPAPKAAHGLLAAGMPDNSLQNVRESITMPVVELSEVLPLQARCVEQAPQDSCTQALVGNHKSVPSASGTILSRVAKTDEFVDALSEEDEAFNATPPLKSLTAETKVCETELDAARSASDDCSVQEQGHVVVGHAASNAGLTVENLHVESLANREDELDVERSATDNGCVQVEDDRRRDRNINASLEMQAQSDGEMQACESASASMAASATVMFRDIETKSEHAALATLSQLRLSTTFRDSMGNTLLHCAAARGFTNVCFALLEREDFAEADAVERQGWTALHYAGLSGHTPVCSVLLTHHRFCAVNALDRNGCTALHYAAAGGHVEVCRLLLRHPRFTAVDAKTSVGCTAVDLATGDAVPLLRAWTLRRSLRGGDCLRH